jgi:hypothetical protein
MRALGFGVLAALVLTGPRLYPLVSDGSMTQSAALIRGGLVAVACAVGFTFVSALSSGYRQAAEADSDETDDADDREPVQQDG